MCSFHNKYNVIICAEKWRKAMIYYYYYYTSLHYNSQYNVVSYKKMVIHSFLPYLICHHIV